MYDNIFSLTLAPLPSAEFITQARANVNLRVSTNEQDLQKKKVDILLFANEAFLIGYISIVQAGSQDFHMAIVVGFIFASKKAIVKEAFSSEISKDQFS